MTGWVIRVDRTSDESPLVSRFQTLMCHWHEAPLSAPFREVTFCASYKCHCFGVKGSRLSWFRPCSALSDLEHVIALATSPRCLGRPRHVQLLLLLGDVGKHRTKALVLDDGSLIDLRPLVEGPIREVHAIVSDRKSAIRIIEDHDPLAGQGSCDLVRLQDKQHLVVL